MDAAEQGKLHPYRDFKSWPRRVKNRLVHKMYRSAVTVAKVTLVFMNIWVMAVVLVVSLGHWRVFDSAAPGYVPENSHLVVMRELKEEGDPRMLYPPFNMTRPEPVILQADPIQEEREVEPPAPEPPAPQQPQQPAPQLPNLNDRVQNLRHWCEQQHPAKVLPEKIPGSKLSSILVDQKHKFLYCQVPGVAQNELRKIILVLSGAINSTNLAKISGGDVYGKYGKSVKRLSDFPEAERTKMLKDFYKVVFVRDPLERLLKAYDMKIASKFSAYFHKAFGIPIIKAYRKDAKPEDLKTGNNVKFNEFIQFIVDTEHKGTSALNEHWLQYYKQCHPCLVEYDFVGKFETVQEDIETVLSKLKVSKSFFTGPLITDTKTIMESVLKKQYATLSGQTLNNLYKVYSADYTLFGYKHPKFMHDLMDKAHVFHDY